jgi:type I restriction-modification system DNA methylase subunit
MVELTAPKAKDVICDPASGTCGFLVAAGEYLRDKHPEILRDPVAREHFHHGMFHGYDFDNTMLRIGSMNMALHGVDNPDIRQLSVAEHEKNNLPDVLERWGQRDAGERQRSRTEQSFCVPKADIAGNGYDLSINRYKEVVHEATDHLPPKDILKKLAVLEAEIQSGMKDLEGMLN